MCACVAKAVDKVGHGDPLRSNIVTIGTDSAYLPHSSGGWDSPRLPGSVLHLATLKYLDVKHKEHPNRSGEVPSMRRWQRESPAVHCVFSRWDRSVSDASAK